MKRKILSCFLAIIMAVGLIPISHAADIPMELDICNGKITITDTGYKQGNAPLETPYTGEYRLVQSNPTPTPNTVKVESGSHTITISSPQFHIDAHAGFKTAAFSLEGTASVNLILDGAVTLKSGQDCAGLQAQDGTTISISSLSRRGSLNAIGGNGGAGIGGGKDMPCGNLTVKSGTIRATGGHDGAGIGSGRNDANQLDFGATGENGVIHITDSAVVSAIGGAYAAGIGGGLCSEGTGTKGQILIDGSAKVDAIGGSLGAGIGGGQNASGVGASGSIIITDSAVVTAKAPEGSMYNGAGIGGGGYVQNSKFPKPQPGTSYNSSIIISGSSKVTASSDGYGAGIGSCGADESMAIDYYSKLLITDNATVFATSTRGSGIGVIGSGSTAVNRQSTLVIEKNAEVHASGSSYGIGGYNATSSDSSINISGHALVDTTAKLYDNSTVAETYGIGGKTGNLNISGGNVSAVGHGGGIGGGLKVNLYGGTIDGNAPISKRPGISTSTVSTVGSTAWVHSHSVHNCPNFTCGVLFKESDGLIYGDLYELVDEQTIPDKCTLTVSPSQELIIPSGKTLTVNGTLDVKGNLIIDGTLAFGPSGVASYVNIPTGNGTIADPQKAFPLEITSHNSSTAAATFDLSSLFSIPAEAGSAVYSVSSKDGGIGTVHGFILSIDHPGTFTVTVKTAPSGFYAAGMSSAQLTATWNSDTHQHHLVEFAPVAATCENPGNIHYWRCSVCEKYYKDVEAITEISQQDVVIPALGHHYVDGICENCGRTDPALGDNPPILKVGEHHGLNGQNLTVPICISNNPGVSSIMLTVSYDPSILTLKDATVGSDFANIPGSYFEKNTDSGSVTLNWIVYPGMCLVKDSTFAELSFQINDNASGYSPIKISYSPDNIFNENEENIAFLVSNGTVVVDAYKPGDINGDGNVDISDALLLLKHVTGIKVDGIVGNIDTNKDGLVNNKDVITLLRHIVNQSVKIY